MMKYNIQCPHCGNILTVEEEWAGQQSFCSHCHLQLTIPPPPSAGNVPPVYMEERVKEGMEAKYLAIAGFLVSLFCCCFVGLILAICAEQKMRKSGDFTGHAWCVATYWCVGIQIIIGIIRVFSGSFMGLF